MSRRAPLAAAVVIAPPDTFGIDVHAVTTECDRVRKLLPHEQVLAFFQAVFNPSRPTFSASHSFKEDKATPRQEEPFFQHVFLLHRLSAAALHAISIERSFEFKTLQALLLAAYDGNIIFNPVSGEIPAQTELNQMAHRTHTWRQTHEANSALKSLHLHTDVAMRRCYFILHQLCYQYVFLYFKQPLAFHAAPPETHTRKKVLRQAITQSIFIIGLFDAAAKTKHPTNITIGLEDFSIASAFHAILDYIALYQLRYDEMGQKLIPDEIAFIKMKIVPFLNNRSPFACSDFLRYQIYCQLAHLYAINYEPTSGHLTNAEITDMFFQAFALFENQTEEEPIDVSLLTETLTHFFPVFMTYLAKAESSSDWSWKETARDRAKTVYDFATTGDGDAPALADLKSAWERLNAQIEDHTTEESEALAEREKAAASAGDDLIRLLDKETERKLEQAQKAAARKQALIEIRQGQLPPTKKPEAAAAAPTAPPVAVEETHSIVAALDEAYSYGFKKFQEDDPTNWHYSNGLSYVSAILHPAADPLLPQVRVTFRLPGDWARPTDLSPSVRTQLQLREVRFLEASADVILHHPDFLATDQLVDSLSRLTKFYLDYYLDLDEADPRFSLLVDKRRQLETRINAGSVNFAEYYATHVEHITCAIGHVRKMIASLKTLPIELLPPTEKESALASLDFFKTILLPVLEVQLQNTRQVISDLIYWRKNVSTAKRTTAAKAKKKAGKKGGKIRSRPKPAAPIINWAAILEHFAKLQRELPANLDDVTADCGVCSAHFERPHTPSMRDCGEASLFPAAAEPASWGDMADEEDEEEARAAARERSGSDSSATTVVFGTL